MPAVAGGLHEWGLVTAALLRRRMAARFLPDVDRVSTSVPGACTLLAV